MYDFLWNLGSFIVALGLLITAHEYGHFWVARRCGVKVERFSIGFGKAIWRRIGKDGTEYVIALIPLGGYVKMLDERVEPVPAELQSQAFNRKSVWQRIAIVAAGPMANFLFAIFALYAMYLIGVPAVKPVIDSVMPGSPAAVIQLDGSPQQVVAVDGQPVRNWEEVNLALVSHIGDDSITMSLAPVGGVQDAGSSHTYRLDTRQWQFDPEKESPITSLGLGMYRPGIKPEIAAVSRGSAAAQAGFQVGDVLQQINGEPYPGWQKTSELIRQSPNQLMRFTLLRAGEPMTLDVKPHATQGANGQEIGLLGITPVVEKWPQNMRLQLQYGIVDAFDAAAEKTWQLAVVTFKMIGKLLTGTVSVSNLSGPISIAQGAGHSAEFGLVYFLGFLALISVNLGIANLLPLPVLDGGHLMYYLAELVTGKPVPEKVQEIGFRFGAAMLLILMSIALFNDFARL
ncbi:zinc metalloprotease [Shewanella sp. NFH-SH190041]|uniref:sigma E protease regulator RseP n=1 Tax=Shewanella sp. NFH-SH190041 TaxID=2950245 RepID=UPI0021C458EB|nr:sigma E protease regulator RseP [Shewanella sp. NFH-SH190041]BDM65316.1 zinc metalloprotease [Shewanella sp. NFH-SH190041]